jgi:peptidoglycan hydrolase-like protein with peptidoglycan-binding domain
VVIDVLGYLPAGTATMVVPQRVLDTRSGQGGTTGPVGNDTTFDIPVAGLAGVPTSGAGTAIVNFTVTEPNGSGFVAGFPSGTPWPGTSNVNFAPGQTAANLALVALGANGAASALVRVVPPPPPPGPPVPEGLAFAPSKRGDRGPHVTELQMYLTFSSFWMGQPDGAFGHLTQQAVMAFQKYVGLPASGAADARTVARLTEFHRSGEWPTARSTSGDLVEVDKTKQLLFIIRGGRVSLTVNTSTGTEKTYREWSDLWQTWVSGTSHTYEGVFRIYRQDPNGWIEGELGSIYRPKYVKGGVAIHGSASIPNYPASHGCIRVSTSFMDAIWAYNLVPLGGTVWVYR